MKKVLFFGIFKPTFIRNAVLIKGFKQNGFEVFECSVDPSIGGLKKFFELYKKGKNLKKEHRFDHVIVAFPGHSVVWLAYLLFGSRIIFDAFLSQYDANVFDRKKYGKFHPLGIKSWLLDWYACLLANKVLLPENVHIDYFVKTFGIRREKFTRVFTGANNDVFKPMPEVEKLKNFTAHFHGTFIPLQGIDYIIEAANILKDEPIHFQIVGSGGTLFQEITKKVEDWKLDKVHMVGRKPLEEVPVYISQAHICLGVFGDTNKTRRVISNKIYECIAVGQPLITSRTPATEELFADREHVLFANPADGKDLANKILELKNDENLRQKIAKGGQELFQSRLTPKKLVENLLEEI